MEKSVLIAGLDEAGRGCLAGPVIAAAVILADDEPLEGLDDSKKLSAARRVVVAGRIVARALAWSVGRAEASEVDRLNVLQASLLAMRRAVAALPVRPDRVRVDGPHYPCLDCPGEAIVRGDASVPEIMAASILAKVCRDREMAVLDALYPGYAFAAHKGYPTADHQRRLGERGACPCHRQSYRPVKFHVRS